jgi:hypothetical protein
MIVQNKNIQYFEAHTEDRDIYYGYLRLFREDVNSEKMIFEVFTIYK